MEILHLAQFFLLTYLFGNSSCISYKDSLRLVLQGFNQVAEEYYGTNLAIGYLRNNEKFYLDETLKAARVEGSERFNVTQTPITIQTIAGEYVGISAVNGSFILLENPSKIPFEFISSTNESYFTINYEDEPLVTLNTRPPFLFYLQHYFPDEPGAMFFIETPQPTVRDIYAGNRSNTADTIEFIRTTDYIDITQGYTELVGIMEEFGHATSGPEIFAVGYYIKEDLNTSSTVFSLLPPAVQYILHEDMVSLAVGSFKLYGSTVSETDTLAPFPYNFTFDPKTWRWSIEFIQEYPCSFFHNSGGFPLSCNSKGGDLFHLSLTSSTDFEIFFTSTGYYYRNNNYFYITTGGHTSSKFTPSPYVIDIENMYGKGRENIPITALAIHKFSDQKLSHYEDLYEQMKTAHWNGGHLEGSEIFSFARFILKDLGQDSELFKALPATVQTLFSETDLSWSFNQTKTAELFSMKYNIASDLHINIQPFHFRFNESLLAPVAISYAGTHNLFIDDEHQLNIFASSEQPSSLFKLHLASDLSQIEIELVEESNDFLATMHTSPDFYFSQGNSTTPRAAFTIANFQKV